MPEELTEQEKRELKTEGFKEAAEYFQSFRTIKDGIGMLKEIYDALRRREIDYKYANFALNSLYKRRLKSQAVVSNLEQEYNCLSLNYSLFKDYKPEDFDNLLKIFDCYHSSLQREVKDLETRTTAFIAAV